MKRILLSLTLMGTAFAGFSQIVYDQEGVLTGNGIVSGQYADSSDAFVASADDFVIPVGGTWMIDRVTVNGFRNDDGTGFTMTNMSVAISADAGGMPGSVIFEGDVTVSVPEPFDEGPQVLGIPTQTMTDGTYWVSVWGDTPGMAGRWNWSGHTAASGNESMLIDPDDLFGAGATGWTPLSGLGVTTLPALSFALGGSATMVSIEEEEQIEMTVFPNPAVDNITITTAQPLLNQATIYDATGQLVISHVNPLNTIDVSDLPAGIYFLEVTTNDGMAQTRFIKK